MFFCINYYLILNTSEGISKNQINVNIFCDSKERSKESAIIIPLKKQTIIYYYDGTLDLINEKAENKKKQVAKAEKNNLLDRQIIEETKIKYVFFLIFIILENLRKKHLQ